jgi:hypothetical protein
MKNHTRLIVCSTVIVGFAFLSFTTSTAQQTAKACEEQWKANKASIQASGKKKIEFISECRARQLNHKRDYRAGLKNLNRAVSGVSA